MDRKVERRIQRRAALTAGRGFACIALDRPADPVNVGHALRAALCFQARLIILGRPSPDIDVSRLPTDPTRAYRHVPVLEVDDLLEAAPRDADLVAVEIVPDAAPLPGFAHPERACYVFGPESGSISDEVLARCSRRVLVPTAVSLNLGMTVGLVLYDRLAKRWRKAAENRADRVSRSAPAGRPE